MRSLQYREVFRCSPEKLFATLHTPSLIRVWWEASNVIIIPEPNGAFAATWGGEEDNPEYAATAVLSTYDPPHRSVMSDARYYAKAGALGFEGDYVIEFRVIAHDEGALLWLTHSGIPSIPEADEYYAGCETGWQQCIANLHKLLNA